MGEGKSGESQQRTTLIILAAVFVVPLLACILLLGGTLAIRLAAPGAWKRAQQQAAERDEEERTGRPRLDMNDPRSVAAHLGGWKPVLTGNAMVDVPEEAQKKKSEAEVIGKPFEWKVHVLRVDKNGTVFFMREHWPFNSYAEFNGQWKDSSARDMTTEVRP